MFAVPKELARHDAELNAVRARICDLEESNRHLVELMEKLLKDFERFRKDVAADISDLEKAVDKLSAAPAEEPVEEKARRKKIAKQFDALLAYNGSERKVADADTADAD